MKKLTNVLILSSIFFVLFYSCKVAYVSGKRSFDTETLLMRNSRFHLSSFYKLNYSISLTDRNGKKQRLKFKMYVDTSENFQIFAVSPALGIEIFRLYSFGDSVFLIDKIHKKYFDGLYDSLVYKTNMHIPFDFLSVIFGKISDTTGFFIGSLRYTIPDSHITYKFNEYGYVGEFHGCLNSKCLTLNYSDYLRKIKIPELLTGTYNNSLFLYNFEIKLLSVDIYKGNFVKFRVSDSYSEF